jgi:hypothetical protein
MREENRNRIEQGRFSRKGHGLGTVTEEMVRQRASELAVINGRSANNLLDSDLDEARLELTGGERLVPPATPAEELTEDQRWDPIPESQGEQAPPLPEADEQTFAEKLVEEGVEDAEQDQMVRATKQALKRDTNP